MPDPRSIDPSECWVRHVRRGAGTDPSASEVGRVYFVRDDIVTGADGLNGRQGWQQAASTAVLSDDGSFTLTLPNVAGDDGVLHRRRFRILTDDAYEPGEEWLEFWTDGVQDRPIFVGTPTDYEKTKSTVTIKGNDLTAVLLGAFSSEVDMWEGHSPVDVLEHYSRLPVLVLGVDGPVSTTDAGPAGSLQHTWPVPAGAVAADCWTTAVRMHATSSPRWGALIIVGGITFSFDASHGQTQLQFDGFTVNGSMLPVTGSTVIELRLIVRYEHVFAFANGELVCELRRASQSAVTDVLVRSYIGLAGVSPDPLVVDQLQVDTLAAFATRGVSAEVERHLPGLPDATGLRGEYFNAAGIYAQVSTEEEQTMRLFRLTDEDAVMDRVDPQVNFPYPTAGFPPNLPGAYTVRWTGAIYLDLAASDRKIRLSGFKGAPKARLYVGRTLIGDEAASSWRAGPPLPPGTDAVPITSSALRAWLGEQAAGWFPIRIEFRQGQPQAGVVLEDTPVDGAGAPTGPGWAAVTQSRLSPIGCYQDVVRLTSHRQVIGDVAQTFGYQWRVQHRSLESGEFPGQLTFKALIGRQTEVVIDDETIGSDVQVTGAADDVVDGLLVDAAGLADPTGSGQLTAQAVDYSRASDHLALRQAYESLSDITEAPLLRTRVDSLLALRSSPNEQVGVRPRGQRDLVDTFPLTGVLARMDWEPGDGVILSLDSVDVQDASPRQLTLVTWTYRRDGLGAPTVGFRQRPRTVRAAMKRLAAAIYGPRRTYQGNQAVITGSPGGQTSAGAAVAGAADAYSRAPLPSSLDDLVRITVVVQTLAGASWRLEVNGTDLGAADGAVPTIGRYDITRVAGADPGTQQVRARLIGGGSGSYLISLEVRVRV